MIHSQCFKCSIPEFTEEKQMEIRERCEKATAGPWAWMENRYKYKKSRLGKKEYKYVPLLLQRLDPWKDRWRDAWDDHVFSIDWPVRKGEINGCFGTEADRTFIANARVDIEILLKGIDQLKMELDRLRNGRIER
jgi:hypothetical protein